MRQAVTCIFLILLLMPLAIHEDANAVKASGKGARVYGSGTASIVCGDKLCFEPKNYQIPPRIETKVTSTNAPEEMPLLTINEKDCPDSVLQFNSSETLTTENSLYNVTSLNAAAPIQLHQGYFDSKYVYYIITDTSWRELGQKISAEQCWPVNHSSSISTIDEMVRPAVYVFSNGLEGNGILGFQSEVFAATPAQDVYTGLVTHNLVKWKNIADSHTLISENEILHAKNLRLITITKSPVVSNMPQIIWPEGQIPVKVDKSISSDTPYLGGQVIDIDLENMTATFIARQGYGPDGAPLYSIVVGATPSAPAEAFGVISSPSLERIFNSSAALESYFFINGIVGPGAMGYQAGIFQVGPLEPNYTPLWRINMISWNSTEKANLLESLDDISLYKKSGQIEVNPAKPMGLDHIINSPIIRLE